MMISKKKLIIVNFIKKEIILKNKKIVYQLRKSRRAKYLRLSIGCDGVLNVSKPRFLPNSWVENLLRQKADWIFQKLDLVRQRPAGFLKLTDEDYQNNKANAFKFVKERLDYFNAFYNFKYQKIIIRNQKSRWGSCSRKGTLSLNCRLIKLDQKLADYVIVHELCHLREFNHSRAFWQLVEQQIPDYRELRKKLKLR